MPGAEEKPFQPLPDGVVPKHYSLVLTPNFKTFNFAGEVSIKLQIDRQTDRIVLNSVDLIINEVFLKGHNVDETPNQIVWLHEIAAIEFTFPKLIEPGTYNLFIKYAGEINDKMAGFYRSKVVNKNGGSSYAVVTQFAPTDARRCFPCWDEPIYKSTFDVSLIVPKRFVALSNMPIKSTRDVNNLVRYDFQTTPIMSTYLVAAAIGEYDYVEERSSDDVLVRVYTPSGKTEQGLFALEVATKTLSYYKKYFDITYSLPKLDLVAIADFACNAMENWGLITFQEMGILVDPKNTSTVQKQSIAILIAHEIAHQWFGNLVTMEWWTHIWLNEGYASFVSYLCVDHLFPQYGIWKQFINMVYFKALDLDCLKNSHPVEVPIRYSSEIGAIFDGISYNKGAAILRMLHHYIGDEDFRKGMHLYLTRFQYKNASTQDLWVALEEASKKPIADVMSTWTKQMGFPVVKVSSTPASDGKDIILSLTQNKFCADGSEPTEKFLWKIPISVSTSKNPDKELVNTVINNVNTDIMVPNVGSQDWIKINPGIFGFYRVSYSPELLERLTPSIRDKSLPPLDRLGILSDLFAMVQSGHRSTIEILQLLQAYEDDTDYNVWSTICKILTKMRFLLDYSDCRGDFKNFEKKLLKMISQKVGWHSHPDETHFDTLLRGLILEHLTYLDDERIVEEARKLFDSHMRDGPVLPPDLRSACYKSVLRAGDDSTFETMINLYRSTDLREEKERISGAFSSIKEEHLLIKALEFAVSDEVRSQDVLSMLTSIATTPVGRQLVWQFFEEHWLEFLDRYQGSFRFNTMIRLLIENFATEEMEFDCRRFFQNHHFPGTERSVQQALETIQLNVAWLTRDTNVIRSFLK